MKIVDRPTFDSAYTPTLDSVRKGQEKQKQILEKVLSSSRRLPLQKLTQRALLLAQDLYLVGETQDAIECLRLRVDLWLAYVRQCAAQTERVGVSIMGETREVAGLEEQMYVGPYHWALTFNLALATGDDTLVKRVIAAGPDRWRGQVGIPFWWSAYDFYRALLNGDEAGRQAALAAAAGHANSGSTNFIGLSGTKPIRSARVGTDLRTHKLPVLVLLEHAAAGRADDFNALLLDRLRKHRARMVRKNYHPSRDDWFDWPAVGALVLARNLRVPVTVSSDFIPEDFQKGEFGFFG